MANGLDPVLVVQRDGHHVEAAADLAEAFPLEVVLRQPSQPTLLFSGHCRLGRISLALASGFHLDENQCGAVARDQIDLAEARPHVPIEDHQALLLKEARSLLLASSADRPPRVHYRFSNSSR